MSFCLLSDALLCNNHQYWIGCLSAGGIDFRLNNTFHRIAAAALNRSCLQRLSGIAKGNTVEFVSQETCKGMSKVTYFPFRYTTDSTDVLRNVASVGVDNDIVLARDLR